MKKQQNTALGIIDAQRGFMPASEGERLGIGGFGELPVPDGDTIIPVLNKLLLSDVVPKHIFTTQDWHPKNTAHFSNEPNFDTTWPVHCVANTLGARIHPLLEKPENTPQFRKGKEQLVDGADDTSYTGFNGNRLLGDDRTWDTVPDFLKAHRIETLYLGGLALDYCVKATAIDFKTKTNMDVVVLSDATKPVAEETGKLAVAQMTELGIRFLTVDEAMDEMREAA